MKRHRWEFLQFLYIWTSITPCKWMMATIDEILRIAMTLHVTSHHKEKSKAHWNANSIHTDLQTLLLRDTLLRKFSHKIKPCNTCLPVLLLTGWVIFRIRRILKWSSKMKRWVGRYRWVELISIGKLHYGQAKTFTGRRKTTDGLKRVKALIWTRFEQIRDNEWSNATIFRSSSSWGTKSVVPRRGNFRHLLLLSPIVPSLPFVEATLWRLGLMTNKQITYSGGGLNGRLEYAGQL